MIHPKILTGKGAVAPFEMESKTTPLKHLRIVLQFDRNSKCGHKFKERAQWLLQTSRMNKSAMT